MTLKAATETVSGSKVAGMNASMRPTRSLCRSVTRFPKPARSEHSLPMPLLSTCAWAGGPFGQELS